MDNELNASEELFFKTGELPPDLASQHTPPVDTTVAADPVQTEAPVQHQPVQQQTAAVPETPVQQPDTSYERAEIARLNAAMQELMGKIEQIGKPQEQQAVEPNPNEDPLGAMLHKLDQVTKAVNALQTKQVEQSNMTQQEREFQNLANNIRQSRDVFMKAQPDFMDAYAHLRRAHSEQLRDVGVPAAQIEQALLQDELAVSKNALASGKNPAQVIYNMAKRYGYAPKAPAVNAADKIAAAAKGQNADVAPPRGGNEGVTSFEGLKDASDSDLNGIVSDDKQWARLVGNRGTGIF